MIEGFIRLTAGLRRRLRRTFLRLRGVDMGAGCWLQAIEVPRHPRAVRLGAGVMLDRGVVLLANRERNDAPLIDIGDGTYINRQTMIDASAGIRIGAGVMIGPGCYLTDHDHVIDEAGISKSDLDESPTSIGDRAWIGAHACILKGVTVGDGAVVAAGAVVTRDVPPGARVAGVPARPLESTP